MSEEHAATTSIDLLYQRRAEAAKGREEATGYRQSPDILIIGRRAWDEIRLDERAPRLVDSKFDSDRIFGCEVYFSRRDEIRFAWSHEKEATQ